MAPIAITSIGISPKVVVYYQTTHQNEEPISMMDLAKAGATHIIIAAVHLHAEDPKRIHINDDPPHHAKYELMWREKKALEEKGIKFLCMLGGAAPGSFSRETLDAPNRDTFLTYYNPLRDMIKEYGFKGIDLDVEQPMTLPGMVRLVDALHDDFGPDFIITLTPVATALMGERHLSGFDYFDLEKQRGDKISWYNVQFYNNWGSIGSLNTILMLGWTPNKVVVGVVTNSDNGSTAPPPFEDLKECVNQAKTTYGQVGGVFGWEYFNSAPGGRQMPWLWTEEVRNILGLGGVKESGNDVVLLEGNEEAEVPHDFEYDSDHIEQEA